MSDGTINAERVLTEGVDGEKTFVKRKEKRGKDGDSGCFQKHDRRRGGEIKSLVTRVMMRLRKPRQPSMLSSGFLILKWKVNISRG
jgi:hypothetical protein